MGQNSEMEVVLKIWGSSVKKRGHGFPRNRRRSVGDCPEIPPTNKAAHWPTSMCPPQPVQRHPVRPEYRLQLARRSSKLWYQIDGTTLNSARRECVRRSSSTCSDRGMRSGKLISRTVRRIRRTSRQKKGSTGYEGYKKGKREQAERTG